MTTFLRLLADKDKDSSLSVSCRALKTGASDHRVFEVSPDSFAMIPGAPFAYWASEECLRTFRTFPQFQNSQRLALRTNGTTDDGRWIRSWWEVDGPDRTGQRIWVPHAKGGAFSPFYSDLHVVISWDKARNTYPGYIGTVHRPDVRPASLQYFFLPGLTWSRRNSTGLSFRVLPKGSIFGDKGPAIILDPFDAEKCLSVAAMMNSSAFTYLVSLQLGRFELAQSYEAGLIQQTPFPDIPEDKRKVLAELGRRAWSLKRTLDTVNETSHAFLAPAVIRSQLGCFDRSAFEAELDRIQIEIDEIAFGIYGFSEADRRAALCRKDDQQSTSADTEEDDEEQIHPDTPPVDAALSWAIGVAFGRFDVRLVTGEREAPLEPAPFDPLPAKSPGMLPDGVEPFHVHAGVLVDDQGHPHDLSRIIEEVLSYVGMTTPDDVRRWLRRDFFGFHLQRYSKSRRKAPIYWPLSTTSGNYTLWIYSPSLSSQTLYTAINDFVEPKLKLISSDVTTLRNKGPARTRDDERHFESLQAFELELIELRETLLKIAPTYKPSRHDGVQITAAPLWPLFRHRPWQKLLKDTWTKFENGEYDWTQLAMNYWPDRVREKCRTDKSLAIAHGREDLYIEPKPRQVRRKKEAGDEE